MAGCRWLVLALLALGLAACVAPVPQQAAKLTPQDGGVVRISEEARVDLPSGYFCLIKAGTRWAKVGSIAQGEVLKPLDQVLMVEGQHVDEGYLVVSADRIVGFYLPGRGSFTPAPQPVGVKAAPVR